MSTVTPVRRYYRGDDLTAIREFPAVGSPTTRYYRFDHQGTTQALTDGTGAVTDRFASDAWGVPVKRTGSSINRGWYAGNWGYYQCHPASLQYVRARHTYAARGEWLSRDVLRSHTTDYAYVLNTPSLFVDPTGWKCWISGYNSTWTHPGTAYGPNRRPTGLFDILIYGVRKHWLQVTCDCAGIPTPIFLEMRRRTTTYREPYQSLEFPYPVVWDIPISTPGSWYQVSLPAVLTKVASQGENTVYEWQACVVPGSYANVTLGPGCTPTGAAPLLMQSPSKFFKFFGALPAHYYMYDFWFTREFCTTLGFTDPMNPLGTFGSPIVWGAEYGVVGPGRGSLEPQGSAFFRPMSPKIRCPQASTLSSAPILTDFDSLDTLTP